jgi:hypothetical protein
VSEPDMQYVCGCLGVPENDCRWGGIWSVVHGGVCGKSQ